MKNTTRVGSLPPSSTAPGRFDAFIGEAQIVSNVGPPLLAISLELLRLRVDTLLIMRRPDAGIDCLRAKVGVAAGLMGKESNNGRPQFRPKRSDAAPPPIARTTLAATPLPPVRTRPRKHGRATCFGR
jgi:hypothetical protein